jgi:hypothetical protein
MNGRSIVGALRAADSYTFVHGYFPLPTANYVISGRMREEEEEEEEKEEKKEKARASISRIIARSMNFPLSVLGFCCSVQNFFSLFFDAILYSLHPSCPFPFPSSLPIDSATLPSQSGAKGG